MRNVIRIESTRGVDQLGQPEDLTWDLFPAVDPELTRHLDESGLPVVGTHIKAGMILIGKIGKTAEFDPGRAPSCLELESLPFSALHSKYGRGYEDRSVYATPMSVGVVESAYIDNALQHELAVVILVTESDASSESRADDGHRGE